MMERCIENAEGHCKSYPRCYGCNMFREPTNADRIRAMSDKELARFMAERNVNESTLLLLNKDHGLTAIQIEALKYRIYCAYVQWLKQPAQEEL